MVGAEELPEVVADAAPIDPNWLEGPAGTAGVLEESVEVPDADDALVLDPKTR